MIQALLRRGIDDGTFRGDISANEPLFLLGRLPEAAVRMTAEHEAGVEKAAALVTSVFLHGTENPARPRPVKPSSAGTERADRCSTPRRSQVIHRHK